MITYEFASKTKIESFWKALDEVARERLYLARTAAPPLPDTTVFISDLIDKGMTQFYALEGNQVVGWCDIIRQQGEFTQHVGGLGMGVIKDYRSMGIGKQLLRMSIEDAFSKGIERIQLDVYASNARAIALYEKLGFQHEGCRRMAAYFDGAYHDLNQMALLRK